MACHVAVWGVHVLSTPLKSCRSFRVALRVLEVPQLSVSLEACGAPLDALAAARAAPRRVALICTARPLFFTWTPDGRRIIAVWPRPSTGCVQHAHQLSELLHMSSVRARYRLCLTDLQPRACVNAAYTRRRTFERT